METGAAQRASTVVYDRDGAAIALAWVVFCAGVGFVQRRMLSGRTADLRRLVAQSGIIERLALAVRALGALTVVAGLIDHMVYSGEFRTPDEVVPTLMEVVLGGLKPGDIVVVRGNERLRPGQMVIFRNGS